MSYILEALKKSEQERTRGVAPNLHAVHAEPFHEGRQDFWFYALAACVLVGVALIGWQRPWQTEKDAAGEPDSPRAASVMPSQPPRIAPQTAVVAAPDRPSVAAIQEPPAPARQNAAQEMEKPAAKAPAPVSENQAKAPQPAVSEAQSKPQAAPSRPQVETPARTASRQDVIDFHELPAAIQRALNKLVITGFVDSPGDPSGQMIAIDNRLLREGDEISPDLRLEQIAAGKAVFGYKGYRFRLPLP